MNTAIVRWVYAWLLAGCLVAGCSSRSGSSRVAVDKAGLPKEDPPLSNREAAARAEAFARFATGVTHELNDRGNDALEQFYKAVEADPENEVLAVELTKRLLQKGQGEKALSLLSKVEARPGSSGAVSAWMARACLQAGKTNQATQAGRNAIRKAPEDIAGYQVLVVEIFLQNGQPQEALNVLAQASSVTSTNLEFLFRVTDLYAVFQRMQSKQSQSVKPQALVLLKRVTALKPTNPAILQRLADNYNLFGDSKTAAEIYLGLIEEYSEESGMRDFLRERLTNVYLGGSEKEKASEQLEAIVRDNPTRYPQAYYFLGMLAADRKEFDKAVDYLNRGLTLRPDHEQSYYDLASVQLNADRPDDALKTLGRARGKFPRSFLVEFFSGLAQNRKKDYAEAVKSFTTAEVIASATEPRRLTSGFYYYFGAAAERMKDYELAEKLFLKSIEIDPKFA
ncbi:MAG: tetratricopeptide repeat protein, partial [Opitutaceae bacterium]|nr:tetratricopeptide repeat protein [Verrucomicrobiales bacterium]